MMLTRTTTPLMIRVRTIKLFTPKIANRIQGTVARSQLTRFPAWICSWTTSRRAKVLDQKVVSNANREKIPARMTAHFPMLSPSYI